MPKKKPKSKKTKYAKRMKINLKAISIILLVVILTILGILYFNLGNNNQSNNNPDETVDLNPRCPISSPNSFQLEICDLLENAIDDQSRAELTATSFVVDYLTWNNKKNRRDIGGRSYITEELRDQFITFHVHGYYNNFLENALTYKVENLPQVSEYTIINSRKGHFDFDAIGINISENDVYEVTIGVTYASNPIGMPTTDLPNNMVITLYKYNDSFYIAKAE